ncbi:MAG: presenilin family intramembrane aspartyl protease [Candidatus Pacearchaeota archaeon]
MKHSIKIVVLLLLMFFVTQLIGLVVVNVYAAHDDNIPYGMSPPKGITPTTSLVSILSAIAFAAILMLLLMKFKTELFLRLWFFLVIILALGISVNAIFFSTPLSNISLDFKLFSMSASSFISLLIALPLAFLKVFRRSILVHNLTELLIYPGIAVVFVPLLNIWTVVLLLIFISIYDIYAVWHAGFMQKMAKYQIKHLKVFSGFFVPYFGRKEKEMLKSIRNLSTKKLKTKKIKVNVAILGGGDIVFPIILAGVVFRQLGLLSALAISIGATLALGMLFYLSKKGKFYPAMPFISAGCFIALGLVYLLL